MRFERELPKHAEPVTAPELQEGAVYFFLNYADHELLIPALEALVFIGRDLEPGDNRQVYFQDIESYRRGIRYGMASEADDAQFSAGSEDQLGHIFEFERALDELLRCFLRRERVGQELRPSSPGFVGAKSLPITSVSPDDRRTYSFRFDDQGLQARLVAALREAGLSFHVRKDGAVTCAAADRRALNAVAHIIRDSCFRWYLSWWKDPEASHRFSAEMKALGLPFHVEYHDDSLVFLLPKENEDLHRMISGRVASGPYNARRP
jgi:hypothetical protein